MLHLDDIIPLRLADLAWPQGTPREGQPIVVYGFAIRRTRGLLLFDTGVGEGSAEVDAAYRPRRRSIQDALAAVGHRPDEVAEIVVSHLHFDHCGQNRLFPGVSIWVQRREFDEAHRPDYTMTEWIDFPGATYKFLVGDADLGPEIHVLSTPGHTPGHQSLRVDTGEGPVLLTGQAAYSRAEFEGHVGPDSEAESYARSLGRLRGVRARRVYFSHDSKVLERG